MSFNAALTSGQLESLRGTSVVGPEHRATAFISTCPNDNVYTARVNQSVFDQSFAQVSYDGAVGTLADIRVGMTVMISHTNDRTKAFFIGRVRKAPTAFILYINETSAAVVDNDYIFVLDDYRIWDKLARDVNRVLKPDYEVSFRQLLPLISNLQSAYLEFDELGTHEFELAPDVLATTASAIITSYLWDVEDGTITVGSSTTKDITVEFPTGFRWIHFTVTDSGGRFSTRHIPVWVHDNDFPATLLQHGDLSITASIDEGFIGSVAAFAGISDLLDNTLVVAWQADEFYSDVSERITSNILMVGRFRSESSATTTDQESGQLDASTQFEIESPLQQLGRLELSPIQIDDAVSPTKFNQVKTLTLWREIVLVLTEYSTFHELHSLSFSETSDTYRERGVVTAGGSLLAGINALANGINAQLQMNQFGESQIARQGSLLPTADRSSLVTVADWTTADLIDLTLGHSHVNPNGRLESSGGSYNSTSKKVTVAQALAPGKAPASGEGTSTLHNQILAVNQNLTNAEVELCIRAGHKFAYDQGADELTVTHPDGYWWLIPAVDQWYTFTLDGSELAKGIVLDTSTRWQLTEVSLTIEIEPGTRAVQATYRRETSGSPAQAIRYPSPSGTKLALPAFPPLPSFPALDTTPDFFLPDIPLDATTPPAMVGGSGVLTRDGNVGVVWNEEGVWVCQDLIISPVPTFIDVTPPIDEGASIIQCQWTGTNPPGLLVAVSGGTPVTFELADYPMNTAVWEPTGSLYGEVTSRSVDGFVVTAGSPAGIDNDGGLRLRIPGVSNFHVTLLEYDSLASSATALSLSKMCLNEDCSSSTSIDSDSGAVPRSFSSGPIDVDGESLFIGIAPSAAGAQTAEIDNVVLEGYYNQSLVFYSDNVFDVAVDWSEGERVAADELAAMRRHGTDAKVLLWDAVEGQTFYSADYGENFDAPDPDGGTPPATPAGVDTQKLGTVSLVGVAGQVQRATTNGGSYSAYGSALPAGARPTALFIPRYKFAGTNNGAGISTPDYLIASDASATGESVWKVTASGVTFTAITPNDGSADGLAIGPNCIHIPWHSTAYQDILLLLRFGSDVKLARSVNGGSTYDFSDALHGQAAYVTTRRSDTQRKQLFIANGGNVAYCANYRASPMVIVDRGGPGGGELLGVEVWW